MFDLSKTVCPTCRRELKGLYIAGGVPWHCKDCAEDKEDPLHCETGCKVRFAYPNSGIEHEKKAIQEALAEGAVYTVKDVYVHAFHTEIQLEEKPGARFNSVFFQRVS